jgi:uncharacterized membrane protein YidH (DUF202 family)
LLLLTSALNGLLKLVIKNPRPFVREGTFLKKWAVSPRDAAALAVEYSTPSGHAMSAASFYSYLYQRTRKWYIRALAVAAILLIGFSRSYLGVHYGEDVLLGWALGLGCSVVAISYFDAFCAHWNKLSHQLQVAFAVAASLALWLLALALMGGRSEVGPISFLGDAGFLTGIVIARPLELRFVNFDPRSSTVAAKTLRFLLTCFLVLCTLITLNLAFGHLTARLSWPRLAWLGLALQYVRYTVAGVVNIFLAPLLFTKMGLAKSVPAEAS